MSLELMQQAARKVLQQADQKNTGHIPAPPLPVRNVRTAVIRCLRAWQRSYDYNFTTNPRTKNSHLGSMQESQIAWCSAMPLLDSPAGIRNFIACVAHGLLIEAIPETKVGQLLYAAQLALAAQTMIPAKSPVKKSSGSPRLSLASASGQPTSPQVTPLPPDDVPNQG